MCMCRLVHSILFYSILFYHWRGLRCIGQILANIMSKFKGLRVCLSISLYLYTVGVLFRVECCIRHLWCSSIILYNITNTANNNHTNIYPLLTISLYLYIFIYITLGVSLFYEMRFHANGTEKGEFILNRGIYRNSSVLVTWDNFGCGSSREHAPWALKDFGIRAIISTYFRT